MVLFIQSEPWSQILESQSQILGTWSQSWQLEAVSGLGFEPWPQILEAQTQFLKPWLHKEPVFDMFVWTSDHLEPCQLFGSWMSAVWILEYASISVSVILASSPVPAQTAVVQGMRPELYQVFRSWTWGPYRLFGS